MLFSQCPVIDYNSEGKTLHPDFIKLLSKQKYFNKCNNISFGELQILLAILTAMNYLFAY